MDKSIFEIRANINHSFTRIEAIRQEREEREKAEREAKWQREREEREKRDAAWKKEHPILDKYTYISSYNYDTYSWPGTFCNVKFYEWSDINNEPRTFAYNVEFYKFLDSCKINLTPEQHSTITSVTGCHITCLNGTHDLVVGKSYDDLKEKLRLANILYSVPANSNNSDIIYDDD